MCNLSLNLIEEGREQERIEGIKKTARFIKNIMENLSLTFEQAIQALGIPKEEAEEYRIHLLK